MSTIAFNRLVMMVKVPVRSSRPVIAHSRLPTRLPAPAWGDIHDELIEVDHGVEQIEMQQTEYQVQDVAGGYRGDGHVSGHGLVCRLPRGRARDGLAIDALDGNARVRAFRPRRSDCAGQAPDAR